MVYVPLVYVILVIAWLPIDNFVYVATLVPVPLILAATYDLGWYRVAVLVPLICKAVVALMVGAVNVPAKVGVASGA